MGDRELCILILVTFLPLGKHRAGLMNHMILLSEALKKKLYSLGIIPKNVTLMVKKSGHQNFT